jgi:hypothetical protein
VHGKRLAPGHQAGSACTSLSPQTASDHGEDDARSPAEAGLSRAPWLGPLWRLGVSRAGSRPDVNRSSSISKLFAPSQAARPSLVGSLHITEPTARSTMAACEGCTCGRANTVKGTSEAEAWTEVNGSSNAPSHGYERREPKSFTAPHDWVEPTGGVEPAVPLRSKLWFNNPGDGVSGCPQHGRQC